LHFFELFRASTLIILSFLLVVFSTQSYAQQSAPGTAEEIHKDWKVKCVTNVQNGNPVRQCYLSQALFVTKTKQKIFEMLIEALGNKNLSPGAIILTLGILLAKGVTVSVSGQKPFALGIRTCNAGGCISKFSFDTNMINVFKAAGKASFQMVDAGSGKPINLTLSLAGFSAAHARLVDLVPKQ
jgi:invasion protein IalB